jgi:hypothetical protein
MLGRIGRATRGDVGDAQVLEVIERDGRPLFRRQRPNGRSQSLEIGWFGFLGHRELRVLLHRRRPAALTSSPREADLTATATGLTHSTPVAGPRARLPLDFRWGAPHDNGWLDAVVS